MAPKKATGKAKAKGKAKAHARVAAHVGEEVLEVFAAQACYFILTRFCGVNYLGFDGEDLNTFVWSLVNATVRKGVGPEKFGAFAKKKGFNKGYRPAVIAKIQDFDGGELKKYAGGWAKTMKALRAVPGLVQGCVHVADEIQESKGMQSLTVEDFYDGVEENIKFEGINSDETSPILQVFLDTLHENVDACEELVRSVMSVYWRVLFFFADQNGDGKLSKKEFQEATGLPMTVVTPLFAMVDKNGDGTLDVDELAAAGTDQQCNLLGQNGCVMQ